MIKAGTKVTARAVPGGLSSTENYHRNHFLKTVLLNKLLAAKTAIAFTVRRSPNS